MIEREAVERSSQSRASDRAGERAGGGLDTARSYKEPPDYYGVPPVHKPHWKWLIITYFFLGGISGGSFVLAAIANRIVPADERAIVRAGRYLSFAALIPCPLLLVLDLGRPSRFLHMLRVLKLRSPMSIGTWGLILFSGSSSASAMIQAIDDGLLPSPLAKRAHALLPSRWADGLGAAFGFLVAGYTGVLLAATAVPLWAKRSRWLGPLFLTSALSTAAAAIELGVSIFDPVHHAETARLRRLEIVLIPLELGLISGWRTRLGSTARPLQEGSTGRALTWASCRAGLLLPMLLHIVSPRLPGRLRRWVSLVASLLVLGGGFALRYAVVVGGQQSADDPTATFDLTRLPSEAETPRRS